MPSITAMTQNVRGFPAMAQRKVRHDIRNAASLSGLIFWQEFLLPRYYVSLYRNLRYLSIGLGWGHSRRDGAQAISWRRRVWKRRTRFQTLLHPVYPGVSDRRFITGAVLTLRADKSVTIAAASTHFLPGAWYGNHDDQSRRREVWNTGLRNLVAFIRVHLRERRPVIIGLDSNSSSRVLFEAVASRIVHHRVQIVSDDVMHLLLIDAPHLGWEVEEKTVVHGVYSDHPGLLSRLTLAPK